MDGQGTDREGKFASDGLKVKAMATPTRDVAARAGQTAWVASFGPFRLSAMERLRERDGAPVHLGGRALSLLIALVDAANEVVPKRDLLARVWPDVVVDEGALRVHMVAIRKGEGARGSEGRLGAAGGSCLSSSEGAQCLNSAR